MPYLPQLQSQPSGRRAERVRFEESTPVVLRFPDGKRSSGQLQVISTTGGLLCLPQPLQPGAVGKLMFLIQGGGSVLGEAQMLNPMSWERQPFRFLALHEDDRTRLQSAIQYVWPRPSDKAIRGAGNASRWKTSGRGREAVGTQHSAFQPKQASRAHPG